MLGWPQWPVPDTSGICLLSAPTWSHNLYKCTYARICNKTENGYWSLAWMMQIDLFMFSSAFNKIYCEISLYLYSRESMLVSQHMQQIPFLTWSHWDPSFGRSFSHSPEMGKKTLIFYIKSVSENTAESFFHKNSSTTSLMYENKRKSLAFGVSYS